MKYHAGWLSQIAPWYRYGYQSFENGQELEKELIGNNSVTYKLLYLKQQRGNVFVMVKMKSAPLKWIFLANLKYSQIS